MRLPDIMELEKFGFYAGFCTSASICTKLTLGSKVSRINANDLSLDYIYSNYAKGGKQ